MKVPQFVVSLLLSVLVILCLGGIGFWALSYNQGKKEQDRQAASAMADDMDVAFGKLGEAQNSTDQVDLKFEIKGANGTQTERGRAFMQSIFNDAVNIRNAYMKACTDSGVLSLLDPAHLAQDKDMKRSRETLAQCAAALDKQRKDLDELFGTLPKRAADYKLPTTVATKALEEAKGPDGTLSYKRVQDLEGESLNYLSSIIDLLEKTKEAWLIKDGHLIFQREEDLNKFNELLEKIQECSRKQTEIQTETLTKAKAKLDGLKSGLGK